MQSPCPVTGINIKLTVTPEGVEHVEPAGAVVSIVIPKDSDVCCDVRTAFCNDVHFFSSPEAASTWLRGHEGALILPVDEGCQLGRALTQHLFVGIATIY